MGGAVTFRAEKDALAAYEGLKDIGLNLEVPTADSDEDLDDRIEGSVLRHLLGDCGMHVPKMGLMEGLAGHTLKVDRESKDKNVISLSFFT